MKRAGFTMIELIFVIVILGILAAVAIPKLAASREDAEATATLASWKGALNQIQATTLSQDAVPLFPTVVDGSANLAVTNTVITAQARVGGAVTTCATATATPVAAVAGGPGAHTDMVIAVSSTIEGCALFATLPAASSFTLDGASVIR